MGLYPHPADPSREQSPASEPDADEPRVPKPLPRDSRKPSGAAMLIILIALAVIALVILL